MWAILEQGTISILPPHSHTWAKTWDVHFSAYTTVTIPQEDIVQMFISRQFSFIGNSTLRSFYASGTPTAWPSLNPYRITPVHWLMARRHLWRNDVVRSYWRTCHPLLRFLCLHEAVTLPFVVAISDPTYLFAIIHLHFGDCLSGTLFSSRWSAMKFRRCQPPCARFIAREDPHSKCIKCLGFSHARDAVYGTSKCKICDDFRLITLRSRLEDCERESSIFPRRASSTSAAPREIAASREASGSREAATWGSDVELEEMESEQTGLAFSLPPSPGRVRANSPVEFLHYFLFPSPGARDTVSFGLDDILHTAASDSEDFGPALADALPPSGQEARPSAA